MSKFRCYLGQLSTLSANISGRIKISTSYKRRYQLLCLLRWRKKLWTLVH